MKKLIILVIVLLGITITSCSISTKEKNEIITSYMNHTTLYAAVDSTEKVYLYVQAFDRYQAMKLVDYYFETNDIYINYQLLEYDQDFILYENNN